MVFSYNANAERRIEEILKDAIKTSHDNDMGLANEGVKDALELLDNKFCPHPLDSDEDRSNRAQSKMRIYEKIIDAYIKIIEDGYTEEADLRDRVENLGKGLDSL